MFFKPLYCFLASILILCFSTLPTFAQDPVQLIAPTIKAEMGETIEVPVKVVDFDGVVSTQFTFKFDPEVLSFVSIPQEYGLQGIISEYFGTPQDANIPDSIVIFGGWFASDIINGDAVPDSTTIFTIEFEVVGEIGDVSPLQFVSEPVVIEIGNPSPPPDTLAYEVYNGSVTVYDPVNVTEVHTDAFRFFPIAPNPASGQFDLRFTLFNAAQTYLSIYDLSGKEIYRTHFNLGSGSHTIAIETNKFPASGTYVVQLATADAVATQRVVVAD